MELKDILEGSVELPDGVVDVVKGLSDKFGDVSGKFEKVNQQYKSLQGIHKGYEEKLENAMKQIEELKEKAKKPSDPKNDDPWSDKAKEALPTALPLIDEATRKIAANVASSQIEPLQATIEAQQKALSDLRKTLATTSKAGAETTAEAILTAQGIDYKSVINSDAFEAALDKEVPVVGGTYRQYLKTAENDPNRMAQIIKAIVPEEMKPNVSTDIVNSGFIPQAIRGKTVSMQEVEAATKKMQKGQISPEKLEEIISSAEKASAEGRLVQ